MAKDAILKAAAKKQPDPFGIQDIPFEKITIRLGDINYDKKSGLPDGRWDQSVSDEYGQLAQDGTNLFPSHDPAIIFRVYRHDLDPNLDAEILEKLGGDDEFYEFALNSFHRGLGILAWVPSGADIEIPALRYTGTPDQCTLLMMSLNRHGIPHGTKQKKNFAETIWANPQWSSVSQNQIAKLIGTSPMNISNWFREFEGAAKSKADEAGEEYESPRSGPVTTADGRTFEDTSALGRPKAKTVYTATEEPEPDEAGEEHESPRSGPVDPSITHVQADTQPSPEPEIEYYDIEYDDDDAADSAPPEPVTEIQGSDGNLYNAMPDDGMIMITSEDGQCIVISALAINHALNQFRM